jgi:hypothetical protein
MSFARFSEGDVYVIEHTDGHYACYGCWLNGDTKHTTPTAAEMLNHLNLHVLAGHEVPRHALEQLTELAAKEPLP